MSITLNCQMTLINETMWCVDVECFFFCFRSVTGWEARILQKNLDLNVHIVDIWNWRWNFIRISMKFRNKRLMCSVINEMSHQLSPNICSNICMRPHRTHNGHHHHTQEYLSNCPFFGWMRHIQFHRIIRYSLWFMHFFKPIWILINVLSDIGRPPTRNNQMLVIHIITPLRARRETTR